MSCVIVLGLYRSGTSAVAGVLHHLGVMMGERFDEPSTANPKGYFEDLDFKDFHKQIMEGKDVDEDYVNLIKAREAKYDLWGVKDPQLCSLLPKLTENLSVDHYLINVERPINEVADSLVRQLGQNYDGWKDLMERYKQVKSDNLEIYLGPILTVNFSELISDTKKVVNDISVFLNLEFTLQAEQFIEQKNHE